MTGQAHSQKDFSIWKREASKEEKEQQERKKVTQEIVDLWKLYSKKYQEFPSLYESILAEKRKLGITLHVICKTDLEKYPKSLILNIKDEEELRKTLKQTRTEGLRHYHENCLRVKYNATFRKMDEFIQNSQWEIAQKKSKKTTIAPNPDRLHIHISSKYKNTFRN